MASEPSGSSDQFWPPEPKLAPIVRKFLRYSFQPDWPGYSVKWLSYADLTETEQSLCTVQEFDAIVAWVKEG